MSRGGCGDLSCQDCATEWGRPVIEEREAPLDGAPLFRLSTGEWVEWCEPCGQHTEDNQHTSRSVCADCGEPRDRD